MRRARVIFCLAAGLSLASCAPLDIGRLAPSTITASALVSTDTPIVSTVTPLILPASITGTPTPGLPPVTETPAPTVEPGKWWEVYFTDPLNINNPEQPGGSIEERLIQLIDAAQTSIHIASFEFNLTPVANALIAAKNRGVDVRWVTDNEAGLGYDTKPGRGQFALLITAGVPVQDDAGRSALMHNKFWIFDGQLLWTGSTNITSHGIFAQNNNVLIIHSAQIAHVFEREFEELWSKQFGPNAPSSVATQWAILDGSAVQVLFSAEDHAIDNLIALVNDAKTSIRFLAFSFTADGLGAAMRTRAAAGVDVKGVFETFGSESPSSELKPFYCVRLPVRQDGSGSFLHDKILIIDNNIVVTGSLNFSANADDKNEENVVIVDNAEIAALYLQEFDKLWNQAHDVDSATFTCDSP